MKGKCFTSEYYVSPTAVTKCKDASVTYLIVIFMVIPCINDIKPFFSPSNAHVEFIKQIKINKAAPTCFGLQGNHHQGASQRLAKITHLVHVDT